MDSSSLILSKENHKLGFFTLLKEALTIPFRNDCFATFTLVTSLPLLFLMVFFESLLEKTLHESSFKHESSTRSALEYWYIPYYNNLLGLENLTKVFSEHQQVILLPVIYLVLLPILEFVTAYSTIYVTSRIYKTDHMWSNIGNKGKFKGFFVTSLIVWFLSTALSLGFIWLCIALYGCNFISWYDLTVLVVYLAGFAIAMPKYLDVSAIWNLSLVISVLGEIHGIDAFAVALEFSKGKEKLGRYLMMVFFVWGAVLRIPCMFFDDGMVGIIGRTTLLWLGILMKWVVCVLYYYQCNGMALDRRVDRITAGSCDGADEESRQEAKLAT